MSYLQCFKDMQMNFVNCSDDLLKRFDSKEQFLHKLDIGTLHTNQGNPVQMSRLFVNNKLKIDHVTSGDSEYNAELV